MFLILYVEPDVYTDNASCGKAGEADGAADGALGLLLTTLPPMALAQRPLLMAMAVKALPRRPSSMLPLAFRYPFCPTSTQLRCPSVCNPGSLDARSERWPGGTVRLSIATQQLSRSCRPLPHPTKFACGCHGQRTDPCGRRGRRHVGQKCRRRRGLGRSTRRARRLP